MPLAKKYAHTTHQTNIHPENVITTVDGSKLSILNSTQSIIVNRYPNDGVQMLKVLLSGTLFDMEVIQKVFLDTYSIPHKYLRLLHNGR